MIVFLPLMTCIRTGESSCQTPCKGHDHEEEFFSVVDSAAVVFSVVGANSRVYAFPRAPWHVIISTKVGKRFIHSFLSSAICFHCNPAVLTIFLSMSKLGLNRPQCLIAPLRFCSLATKTDLSIEGNVSPRPHMSMESCHILSRMWVDQRRWHSL